MHSHFCFRRFFAATLLASPLLLTGCADDGTTSSLPGVAPAKGNWQITASPSAATTLPMLSGAVSVAQSKVSAVLHPLGNSACLAPGTSFALAGQEDAQNDVTLSGPVAGGTMRLTGTVAPDGNSLTNASYAVSGGTCATPKTVLATAQAFAAVNGTYAGNFADADGQVAQVTAHLSQSPSADPNGNFTLSLSVGSWNLSGSCGADTGVASIMTRTGS